MTHKTTLPIHPLTGLQAVGMVAGRPVWPIRGGSGDGDGDGGAPPKQDPPKQDPPKQDPPPKNDGPPAGDKFSADQVDAIVKDRLARDRAARDKQFADYADLKKKAGDYDRLLQDTESDAEKRVREAADKARTDVLAEMRPRLVLAEMRAIAAGRIESERFDTLVDDLDLSKYLTSDGAVDTDKVRRKVDAWAPPKQDGEQVPPRDNTPGPRRPRPDSTQGSGAAPTTDGQRGIDEARRRYGDRATGPAATSK